MPLVSREVVVNLIGSVTTKGGLTIRSELDESSYETGRKVTPEQINALSIERDKFHGEWNDTLAPRQQMDNSSCPEPLATSLVPPLGE